MQRYFSDHELCFKLVHQCVNVTPHRHSILVTDTRSFQYLVAGESYRILVMLPCLATESDTRYKPFGPRRVIPQDHPQGYPPFHADSEGMYSMNGSQMASVRIRSHPYAPYGVPPLNLMNGSMDPYKYNPEPGSY